jgi:hypothetical protein
MEAGPSNQADVSLYLSHGDPASSSISILLLGRVHQVCKSSSPSVARPCPSCQTPDLRSQCGGQVLGVDTWLEGGLSGTQRTGGLTEAQLTDELSPNYQNLPIPRNASATISWWQLRQAAFNRALQVCAPSCFKMPAICFRATQCALYNFRTLRVLKKCQKRSLWGVAQCCWWL